MPYMICSEPSAFALEVGDVLDEVVGLPVEAERCRAPQRERRVAHPAVAVVPVALAARRLRQRGRRRGDDRAGRRVGQPLQRQRRALQLRAPAVVGEAPGGEPVAPVLARSPRGCAAASSSVAGPSSPCDHDERAEAPLALGQRWRARAELPSIPSRRSLCRRSVVVAVAPRRRSGRPRPCSTSPGVPSVVEHRLADQLDLHRALEALDRAHQHVVGVVVGRRARVRGLDRVLASCHGPMVSAVAHDDPAGRASSRSSRASWCPGS